MSDRRGFLRSTLAFLGFATGCARPAQFAASGPAADDATTTDYAALPPNEYLIQTDIPRENAASLLGREVRFLSMGAIAILETPPIAQGGATSSQAKKTLAIQVNHQRAFFVIPSRDGGWQVIDSSASCDWDSSAITRISGALETLILPPLEQAPSPETPHVVAVTSGLRADSHTNCGTWDGVADSVISVRVGNPAGPPGRVTVESSVTGRDLELLCNISPWTRIVVHGRAARASPLRLVWASDRYEILRALPATADQSGPTYRDLEYRRALRLEMGIEKVEATLLDWVVPDLPRACLTEEVAWQAFLDALPQSHYRRMPIELEPEPAAP